MLGNSGQWNKAQSKKHSAGWCGHAGSYTQYADVNGDGKVDMTCDDTSGRHWTAFHKGNGSFFYKYEDFKKGFKGGYKWCFSAGGHVKHVDINGDGKADMMCTIPHKGFHWLRTRGSTSYSDLSTF